MLPEGFQWLPAPVGGVDYGDRSLVYAGTEVARVTRRVDGNGWLSEVRRYAYPRPSVRCSHQETAIRWASRWAEANADRIRQSLREREARLGLKPATPGTHAVPSERGSPAP